MHARYQSLLIRITSENPMAPLFWKSFIGVSNGRKKKSFLSESTKITDLLESRIKSDIIK